MFSAYCSSFLNGLRSACPLIRGNFNAATVPCPWDHLTLDALLHYIDTQAEHRRTRSFQDEYRAFLEKYGIEYEERYVWD